MRGNYLTNFYQFFNYKRLMSQFLIINMFTDTLFLVSNNIFFNYKEKNSKTNICTIILPVQSLKNENENINVA